MRRLAAVALVALVCALGTVACTDRADITVAPTEVPELPAAGVGRIVCVDHAIRVETPLVRAHADGVHFVIENPGGAWGVDLHADSWDDGTAEGFDLNAGVTNDTSAMGPGGVTVGCLPKNSSSYTDPDAPTATLTIVDPDGLYVPWDLACGFGEQSRITMTTARDEDPEDVFRRVLGIRPSDVFMKPNYPESAQYGPTFAVFRDSVEIARIMGYGIAGEWKLLVNACPGSGIAGT